MGAVARRPGPSFRALLFRCGEGAVCEPSRLEDKQLRELVFLSVQKATLGTGGRGPQARSVLQGPSVSGVAKAPFVSLRGWKTAQTASFLVSSESNPFVSLGGWKTAQRASFLVGSESNVRQWGPWPAGPVRPSGPCCFGVAKAPFVSLRGWKTAQTASFLVGSESNVRQWGPWPAGPVRPSGPGCFGVAKAAFVSLGGWKRAQTASFLVGSESNARHWGPWPVVPVRPSEFRCLVKPPFVISSAQAIGRCDTAFRWAYDA